MIDPSRLRRAAGTAAPWALGAGFFVAVAAFHPFREVFAFDPDEGNNLLKALLLARGHALYSEIWSDQPPLFAHLLRWWMELFGWTVESGRLLVVLCSSVLLGSLFAAVRAGAGAAPAAAACALLVLSLGYVPLSVSVMLAVPSLALAMLAVAAALHGGAAPRPWWLLASGALLAMAVLTKMWTALLIGPAALAGVLAARHAGAPGAAAPRPPARALGVWCAGFAVALVVVGAATVPIGRVGDLVLPHLEAGRAGLEGDVQLFWRRASCDLPVALLALLGIARAADRRLWQAWVPALWLFGAAAALAVHRPLWYHHYPLLSVPACWLAGIGAMSLLDGEALAALRGPRHRAALGRLTSAAVALVLLVLAAGVGAPRLARAFAAPDPASQQTERLVAAAMARLAPQTRCVVTDHQMLAFRAGLAVPPSLAVTSLKRIATGRLTTREIIAVIDAERPEQIVLTGRRVPLDAALLGAIDQRYRLAHVAPPLLYWVADDLEPEGAGQTRTEGATGP